MITEYEIHQSRAEKGRRLSPQVTQHQNGFYVRSESHGAKLHNVTQLNGQWHCSCDDFRYRSEKLRMRYDFRCKHIIAVQFAMQFGTVHGTRSVEETRKRVERKQRGAPRRSFTTGVVSH